MNFKQNLQKKYNINTFYLKLMDIAKIMGWNGSCIFFFGEYPFPKE